MYIKLCFSPYAAYIAELHLQVKSPIYSNCDKHQLKCL